MTYRIFLVQPDGEVSGTVDHAFSTRQAAEERAEHWRSSHDYKHTYEVYYTDAEGRIRIPPATGA